MVQLVAAGNDFTIHSLSDVLFAGAILCRNEQHIELQNGVGRGQSKSAAKAYAPARIRSPTDISIGGSMVQVI